ncbi:MAG TPA: helix-turn-helix domain-containing protein [Candidatus Limnocylindrales bacterium]
MLLLSRGLAVGKQSETAGAPASTGATAAEAEAVESGPRGGRCPRVGRQVRRWRTDRGLTLARVSEGSGLNVGYLSQIENDKAVPSLEALASLAAALDVPIGWFLIDDAGAPRVVRASERPVRSSPWGGRIERVDGGVSRDISIVQVHAEPGTRTGGHAHAGDEHHIIVSGRWRMEQNDHAVEVGAGDYVVWDAELPHDVELLGAEPGSMLIVSVHPTAWDPSVRRESERSAG